MIYLHYEILEFFAQNFKLDDINVFYCLDFLFSWNNLLEYLRVNL